MFFWFRIDAFLYKSLIYLWASSAIALCDKIFIHEIESKISLQFISLRKVSNFDIHVRREFDPKPKPLFIWFVNFIDLIVIDNCICIVHVAFEVFIFGDFYQIEREEEENDSLKY